MRFGMHKFCKLGDVACDTPGYLNLIMGGKGFPFEVKCRVSYAQMAAAHALQLRAVKAKSCGSCAC